MSDWKQAEKTAQPVLNLVGASEVEDCDLASSPVAQAGTSGVRDEFPAPLPRPAISGASGDESVAEAPTASVMNGVDSPGPEVAAPSLSLSGAVPPDLGERYQVLSLLGEGGMGTVWKVFDRDLQETFAVKVLRPELATDETLIKRFAHEAKLACELTHANIAAIFGPCFDKQGHPGVIMRYVEGESLAELLAREGKLSVERTTFILRQICDALAHSHMKGIVHRDIKPSNIIIAKTDDGSDLVQLVDFGIAQSVYTKATATQALTRSVDVLGSPSYMSPEQFLGAEITAKSDIYSLGCVVYEMLTGAPPFEDENPVRLVLKHLNEAPDLLKVPESMRSLVSNCLCKEAFYRPRGVEELVALINYDEPGMNGEERRLPILLALFSFLSASLFSTSSQYCYLFSLFLFLLAVGTMAVNFYTACPGRFGREFERSFFSAAVCSALLALCSALVPYPWQGLGFLLTFFLLIFLNVNPSAVRLFYKFKLGPAIPSRLAVKCIKIIYAILEILVLLLILNSGFSACHHLINSLTGFDLGLYFLLGQILSMLSLRDIGIALIGLSILDLGIKKKLQFGHFLNRFKQVSLCYSFGLLAASLCTLLSWQPGLEKVMRQISASSYGVTRAKKAELEGEALKYPHGGFFSRARLVATEPVYSFDNARQQRQLELLNQIVGDKTESNCITLAQAYWTRYYLRATMGVKWEERRGDWDAALNNIRLVLSERTIERREPHFSLESLRNGFRRWLFGFFASSAEFSCKNYSGDIYQLTESAVQNRDFERAKKALVVLKSYYSSYMGPEIRDLEERM